MFLDVFRYILEVNSRLNLEQKRRKNSNLQNYVLKNI